MLPLWRIIHVVVRPLRFQRSSWEKAYQNDIRCVLEASRMLIGVAASPSFVKQGFSVFQLHRERSANLTASTVLLSGAYLTLCVLLWARCFKKAARIVPQNAWSISMIVRMFSACSAYDVNFRLKDGTSAFEVSIRWFAVCALGIPTFEEALAWSLLILGCRPLCSMISGSFFDIQYDRTDSYTARNAE